MEINGDGCLGGLEARFARDPWVGSVPQVSRMPEASDRLSCLEMLMSRFGIQAAMVSVPQLARLLGRSKSTVYASVKKGRFFIPHRMVGESPMFTVDEVVTWYLRGDEEKQGKSGRRGSEGHTGNERRERFERIEVDGKRSRDRGVDEMVARVLSSMAR